MNTPVPPTTLTTKDNEIRQLSDKDMMTQKLSILIAAPIKHNLYDEQYKRYLKMIERYIRTYTEIKEMPKELSQFEGTRNEND